jgi:hypothetical protein
MTREAATRKPSWSRDIGRPVLAYVAAAAAAAAMIALGHWTPWLAGFATGRSSIPDPVAVALSVFGAWLVAFAAILPVAAGPTLVAAWIGHGATAPRPLTDIVVGAVLGPMLLVLVVTTVNVGSGAYMLPPQIDETALGGLYALAGGVGGWVYALVVGRRA